MSGETISGFAATRWSLVDRAAGRSSAERTAALNHLLRAYHEPMRRFLMARFGHSRDAADDLVQGFILANVIEKNLIESADREKGRFRTFLLTALKRYAANQWRAARAQRRGAGKIAILEEATDAADTEAIDAFDVAWAREVLSAAVKRVEEECRASSRPEIWGIFEARVLRPTLEQHEPPALDELVVRFKLQSPGQASNLLVSGKRMFVRALRTVVGEYGDGNADVEQEIADLQSILAKSI